MVGLLLIVKKSPMHTQGQTIEEAKKNLKDAIELILDCEREIAIKKVSRKNFFFGNFTKFQFLLLMELFCKESTMN